MKYICESIFIVVFSGVMFQYIEWNDNHLQFIYNENILIDDKCEDKHRMCPEWSLIGECEANPNFMLQECKKSCRLCMSELCHDKLTNCEQVVNEYGCHRKGVKNVCSWYCQACDLVNNSKCERPQNSKRLFENITLFFESISQKKTAIVLNKDPWIIQMKSNINFEADNIHDWSPSLAGDGKHSARTSSTTWISDISENSRIKSINDFIKKLGLNLDHSEPLQLLKYNPTEFYKTHHDQNSPQASPWGPRVITVLFYLSNVEEGGETNFPDLGISVKPSKGDVIIWPSVKEDDMFARENRTNHEAVTVSKGVKYVANYWFHLFSFRNFSECSNKPYANNWELE